LEVASLDEVLRTHLNEEKTIGEFMAWFVHDYVIMRAEEVRQQKESGTSTQFRGWFQRQDTGWEPVKDHSASHWSARFGSCLSILRDLALLDPNPDKLKITPAGRELLETRGMEAIDG
jgi:hypothetical protein